MRFILLSDKGHKEKWDEYIISCRQGTFADLHGWENIYKLYDYKSFPVAAIDDSGRIRGILRLFLRKNMFGRKFLVSNPFLSYGGICADDEEIKKSLILKAQEIAVDNNVEYIEIRQFDGNSENLNTKNDFVAMFLNLNKGDEYIWKISVNAEVRNRVRKAIKSGLTVDFGKKYFDDFYRVLAVNHRDLGTPLHNKTFFRKVLEEFHTSSNIIVVNHRDKVIAGMLCIYCKTVFSDPWVSSLREYNKLCPNNILYWEAIKYACRNGFEYFDFGRSTIDSGTYVFKKRWGAEPVQLNYQYFLNKAHKIPNVNAHDNKYQIAINIWKRLPLKIANTIGPRVIKYLPEL
jgi:serine/alanine adding enzyme